MRRDEKYREEPKSDSFCFAEFRSSDMRGDIFEDGVMCMLSTVTQVPRKEPLVFFLSLHEHFMFSLFSFFVLFSLFLLISFSLQSSPAIATIEENCCGKGKLPFNEGSLVEFVGVKGELGKLLPNGRPFRIISKNDML